MAATSRNRSNSGPVLPNSSGFQPSLSPSVRLSASAFASYSSSFASRSSTFFHGQHSACPTRVNIVGSPPRAPSVRFSLDRPISPGHPLAIERVLKKPIAAPPPARRRTCMCSPTSHPGSFRCSLHKGFQGPHHAAPSPSHRLNARRSAMTNSLVRIGTVEGDLVRRALVALIRPSSHHQRRRADFRPRPSRLSVVSKADDL